MKNLKYKIAFVISLGISFFAQAQEEDCSQKLKKAQAVYDQGVIENVESMIRPCLESESFSKAEKVEAYKLLTLIGLFEDRFSQAEENMTLILKTDPDFRPKATDAIELKELYDKFRTDPVFTIGIKVGLNRSSASLIKYHSSSESGSTDTHQPIYKGGMGFQAALSYNHRIDKGLYINFDPSILVSNHSLEDSLGDEPNYNRVVGVAENNMMATFNLGVSNDFNYKKPFKPYVELGGSFAYFLNSSAVATKDYTDQSSNQSVQETTVKLLGGNSTTGNYTLEPNRTSTMYSIYYGLGFKSKVGSAHFLFGIRHYIGLSNITENKYNRELYGNYDYVLDDVSLNNIVFNVGFVQSIYKPKILKRKLKK